MVNIYWILIVFTTLFYLINGSSIDNVEIDQIDNHPQVRFIQKRQAATPSPKQYKECTAPNGIKGFCVPSNICNLPPIKDDIWKALNYFCVMDSISIGICCSRLLYSNTANIPIYDVNDPRNTNEVTTGNHQRGCGLTTKQFPRLTGSREAEPEEWPWVAAIFRRLDPTNVVWCGGVLIDEKHVLTAAHCTDKYNNDELIVRLGEYDIQIRNETRSRDFRIQNITQHIDYNPVTYDHDIAILKLERSTIYNSYIWPVCLPHLEDQYEGWDAVVIGWGTQRYGGKRSNILMEVSIPIWNHEKCFNTVINHQITTNMICAGDVEEGKDSCQGDSGGPLLVQLPDRRWTVIGLVSWGEGCGFNTPGIYTSVSKHLSWVLENVIN